MTHLIFAFLVTWTMPVYEFTKSLDITLGIPKYESNVSSQTFQFPRKKRNRYLYIKLNPNPASDRVSVQLYGLYSVKNIESVYICDMLGRKILDGTEEAKKNSDGTKSFFDLYINGITPGAYLVVLQGDIYFKTKQLSIIR